MVIAVVLTMVGLGGGLIFPPLFVLLGLPKTTAVSVSLFLNLLAAGSAACTYGRKKMVDFSLSVPLIIASSLTVPWILTSTPTCRYSLLSSPRSLLSGQAGARLMSTKLKGRHVWILLSLVLFTFCAKMSQQFFI
jgi:hypothetical protein